MYEQIKKLAKQILPASFINKNETALRSIIALKYKGDKVFCAVCKGHFSSFISLNNGELLCPKCGCLPRTRRLYSIITKEPELKNKSVLHFSPPKSLKKALKHHKIKNYTTTDYENEFDADKKLDITNINEPDNSYDIIICYHVLEHIDEDRKAMKELYRVLKPQGKCFIQTPFKEGEIYENKAIKTPKEREKHFGQHDHVRVYSVKGLVERLEATEFDVDVKYYEQDDKNGFNSETVIEAQKSKV